MHACEVAMELDMFIRLFSRKVARLCGLGELRGTLVCPALQPGQGLADGD